MTILDPVVISVKAHRGQFSHRPRRYVGLYRSTRSLRQVVRAGLAQWHRQFAARSALLAKSDKLVAFDPDGSVDDDAGDNFSCHDCGQTRRWADLAAWNGARRFCESCVRNRDRAVWRRRCVA
jgi:hypothetical protein